MNATLKLIEDDPHDGSWARDLNERLRPAEVRSPVALDLFAGCGGLALGFEAAGFETHGIEMNSDACKTYESNLSGDITESLLSPEFNFPKADLVIGGPPCQPFSVGGKQLGLNDSRDGFPIFIAAVEKLRPQLFLFENVRGLFYKNRWYLDQILERLGALGYEIEIAVLNAKAFGVPQNRERVIVVGHKGRFKFPEPVRLGHVTAGEALDELAFAVPSDAKFLTPSMDAYVARYEKASKCVNPRDLALDRPARTLTCRNLAGATGDMHRIKLPDGRRRRLNVREAARLQSFPDWFSFAGGETSQFNQIGNAVPPLLGLALAESMRTALDAGSRRPKARAA